MCDIVLSFVNDRFARKLFRADAFGSHQHLLVESRGDTVMFTGTVYATVLLHTGCNTVKLCELNPGREVEIQFVEGSELCFSVWNAGEEIPFRAVA